METIITTEEGISVMDIPIRPNHIYWRVHRSISYDSTYGRQVNIWRTYQILVESIVINANGVYYTEWQDLTRQSKIVNADKTTMLFAVNPIPTDVEGIPSFEKLDDFFTSHEAAQKKADILNTLESAARLGLEIVN